MNDWLQTITDSLAARIDLDPVALTLSSDDRRLILEVARIASHASGERINAPLLCFALGVAAGRGRGIGETGPIAIDLTGGE